MHEQVKSGLSGLAHRLMMNNLKRGEIVKQFDEKKWAIVSKKKETKK